MPTLSPGLTALDRALAPYREYGPLFIRLVVGYRLVWGTMDNVFSYAQMVEFAGFLEARGVPWPLGSAFISAYAQFICGLLFLAGGFTRPAAAVMVFNFIAALLIAHIGQPFLDNYDALVMLFGAAFLLLHGPGALSVDERVSARAGTRSGPRG
ncbi:MAG: DoxX family protein [Gemmatimonadales bacterium]|nr:DoxX family protein [Gemmatimonadales bacterium]